MAKVFGNKWEVQRDLEEGGQGWTYVVQRVDKSDDLSYVLKRLKNADRVGRFRTEIESIGQLSHPAVLKLIDFDVGAAQPYFVTEYCNGGSLARANPFWRSDPVATMTLFESILEGVAHAHSNGIVHRDIKPDNIFLRGPSGPPVVGDFGLSYMEAAEERHTGTEEGVGPRLYMAPELEDGRTEIRPSADIYSLGKLLYWLFTGRVFSREKHRDPAWDLRGEIKDPFTGQPSSALEHVNELLDLMVVAEPAKRRDIDNLRILTTQAKHLIGGAYHPRTLKVSHQCDFCGRGVYEMRLDGDAIATRNFGLTAVTGNRWRALVCNNCSHVQLFNFGTSTTW